MKWILLINEASRGGRELPGVLTQWIAQRPELVIWRTSSPSELTDFLRKEPLSANDLIVVFGGDGTVQLLLGELFKLATIPVLALLPGGSTNMSANGVNRHRRLTATLQTLSSTNPHQQHLPTIMVKDSGTIRLGFFFGVGQIVNGIEYTNRHLFTHDELRHEGASGLALLRILWGVLRQDPKYVQSGPLALQVDPEVNNLDAPDFDHPQPALLLLATTLRRLLFGFVPYWNGATNRSLKLTWIASGARGLWYRLPGLFGLWGFRSPDRRPERANGYHSFGAQQVELSITQPYTLDGEIYSVPDARLTLTACHRFRFLVL